MASIYSSKSQCLHYSRLGFFEGDEAGRSNRTGDALLFSPHLFRTGRQSKKDFYFFMFPIGCFTCPLWSELAQSSLAITRRPHWLELIWFLKRSQTGSQETADALNNSLYRGVGLHSSLFHCCCHLTVRGNWGHKVKSEWLCWLWNGWNKINECCVFIADSLPAHTASFFHLFIWKLQRKSSSRSLTRRIQRPHFFRWTSEKFQIGAIRK